MIFSLLCDLYCIALQSVSYQCMDHAIAQAVMHCIVTVRISVQSQGDAYEICDKKGGWG